jgi:predicted nucleotidyltransferase
MCSRQRHVSTAGRITIDPTMTDPDLEPQNRLIVECLRRTLDPLAIYRFGSTAHGTASAESDHDIAVLARARIAPALRFDVQEQLAAALGRDVDLVDLASASTVMAMQAIGRGELLFDGDAAARGDFEDRIYSAYARLNEERRGILERAAAEGTVYGR